MPAEKLVQRLVRWMCGLVLHADIELIDDLLLLTRKAVDVTQNSQALVAIDMAKKEEEYLLQEATCVANFLVTYTLPLSRHLKE